MKEISAKIVCTDLYGQSITDFSRIVLERVKSNIEKLKQANDNEVGDMVKPIINLLS